jgi:hypothetical protein
VIHSKWREGRDRIDEKKERDATVKDVTLEVADGLRIAEEACVIGVGGGAEGAEDRAEAAQAQEREARGRVAEAAPQRQR